MENGIINVVKTFGLFTVTAFAEIIGCYLSYLWISENKSGWILFPAIVSLVIFVWLLTLHPYPTGKVYAAYGGVYISASIMWLWLINSIQPSSSDLIGALLCILGMIVIIVG